MIRHRQQATRRGFLKASAFGLTMCAHGQSRGTSESKTPDAQQPSLVHKIGIVSASAAAQLTGRATGRHFSLLDLPQILKQELDLTVLDLNTSSFPDFANIKPGYVERLRESAREFGVELTNLKMNQAGLDMNSVDADERQRALAEYKRSIDVASELGCRWARPLPGKEKPEQAMHVASYQELCEYGAKRNVQLLIENFGWMQSDPEAVSELAERIGHKVAVCPDTGNWNSNEIRYAGLTKSFPLAVTCDFKAKQMSATGGHSDYDLRRCFDIAWDAGFRGPWAIEHGNADSERFFAEVAMVRDMLRGWMAERSA